MIIYFRKFNNINNTGPCQNYRGLFRNPFVIQTFATHLIAIQGARKLKVPQAKTSETSLTNQGPGSTCNEDSTQAKGALALSVAAVSYQQLRHHSRSPGPPTAG
jgi:hypothetical protein